MPITTDSLNKKLYGLLKVQGFDPIPKNSKGDTTPVPNEADVFKFTFKIDGKPIGPAWVTIDSNNELKVYYDDEVMGDLKEEGGKGHIDDFTEFLKSLKMWAQRKQLGFKLENQDHLESDMAQREYIKKQEQINEGYYPMGKTASYNDSVPTVKIVLQHTRAIQEGEQRFRNIAKIFLENTEGERILAPTTRPGIAKVYARHLAEGGLPHDERWSHIGGLVEEYTKMAGFVRATRGNQFNESAQQLVNEGINHYQSLRETLSRMIGHKGYNAYFESWTPALMETEGEESSLNELFVQETLDPRIESVMPILNRIHKKVNEMNEVKALEEWADTLINEKMVMGSGSDASSAGSYKMGEAADLKTIPKDELDESSETTLDNILSKHYKAVEKFKQGGDMDYDLESDLWDYYFTSGDIKNYDADASEFLSQKLADHLGIDESLDESGLQAYLGNKKYGKEGMDALRKAGREHAGKEKMAKIRAKYDKLDEVDMEEGLGDVAKKVGGALKAAGKKALDVVAPGDEELLRQLQKSAGVRGINHGKPSMAQSDVEKVEEVDMGQYDAIKSTPKGKEDDDVFKKFREKVRQYGDELGQRQKEKEKEVDEGLDANQKRVGQLGPTEKVGPKGAVGKLVGANESVEQLGELKKSTVKSYADKKQAELDDVPPMPFKKPGMSKAEHEKAAKGMMGALARLSGKKPTSEGSLNEMDSEGYKGTRDDYEIGKGKEGKAKPVKPGEVAKKGADALNKAMDKEHKKKVKEGQEDLDAILRIIRK